MLSAYMWFMKRGNLSPAAATKTCRRTTGQVWHLLRVQRFTPGTSLEKPGGAQPTAGEDNAQIGLVSVHVGQGEGQKQWNHEELK